MTNLVENYRWPWSCLFLVMAFVFPVRASVHPFIQTHQWDLRPLWQEVKSGYALFAASTYFDGSEAVPFSAPAGTVFPDIGVGTRALDSSAWQGRLRQLSDSERLLSATSGNLPAGTYRVSVTREGRIDTTYLEHFPENLDQVKRIQVTTEGSAYRIRWAEPEYAFSYYVVLAPVDERNPNNWIPISSPVHTDSTLTIKKGRVPEGRYWIIVRSNKKWQGGPFWALGAEVWSISGRPYWL